MKTQHPMSAKELRPGMTIVLDHQECFIISVERNIGNMVIVKYYIEDDKPPHWKATTVPPGFKITVIY